ncbi:cell death-inducing p53-target protein 1-like [Setaria italica]|uniref:cell death-inducing p53-target protein 1-like n=1 Tax=Setaria italica TaxID=4555 RepID=UPI000645503B|nr:cell death-inducing p53-target protein 1-like [Setaria italica]
MEGAEPGPPLPHGPGARPANHGGRRVWTSPPPAMEAPSQDLAPQPWSVPRSDLAYPGCEELTPLAIGTGRDAPGARPRQRSWPRESAPPPRTGSLAGGHGELAPCTELKLVGGHAGPTVKPGQRFPRTLT